MGDRVRQIASSSGIAAVVMIVYGFGFGGFESGSGSGALYEASFPVFNWTLKIGGITLAVVAALSLTGWRGSLLIDFLISGTCGVLFTLCAVTWTFAERGFDVQNLLILIFGVLFVRAGFGSWSLYQTSAAERPSQTGRLVSGTQAAPIGMSETTQPVDATQPPVHPASIHPEALPKEGEPPPPEGYLAALSNEEEEPPGATYE